MILPDGLHLRTSIIWYPDPVLHVQESIAFSTQVELDLVLAEVGRKLLLAPLKKRGCLLIVLIL